MSCKKSITDIEHSTSQPQTVVTYERRILIQKLGPMILQWLIPLDHF